LPDARRPGNRQGNDKGINRLTARSPHRDEHGKEKRVRS
jgi:hypothetical protein